MIEALQLRGRNRGTDRNPVLRIVADGQDAEAVAEVAAKLDAAPATALQTCAELSQLLAANGNTHDLVIRPRDGRPDIIVRDGSVLPQV